MQNDLINLINENAAPIRGEKADWDAILSDIGDARFVLLGEASHGTHEFYKARAEITKRLIEEKNFSAIAVEADFPDAYRVNRYVFGFGSDHSAEDALSDFRRFPLWMWRNRVILELVNWLKSRNEKEFPTERIGFYGLDLYSLHSSIEAVLSYLKKVDPPAAQRASYRYSCFEDFGEDPQSYGYAANFNMSKSCEDEVVEQLLDLKRRAAEYANMDGFIARDEYFFAEQNARLVKNAEEYYRQMFDRRVSSWNLRDKHMTETLSALAGHLENEGKPGKIVVWAHNSHLGDASATEMGERGEWNVGQLTREKFGREDVRNIGFTTYAGTVTAATNWDEPAQLKKVRNGLRGSYENLFHQAEPENFYLDLRDRQIADALRKPLLERAIGVIYRPQTERVSHYFHASLSEQFDAVIHFDKTRAVEPLDDSDDWRIDTEGVPETFPSGL